MGSVEDVLRKLEVLRSAAVATAPAAAARSSP